MEVGLRSGRALFYDECGLRGCSVEIIIMVEMALCGAWSFRTRKRLSVFGK
jgi:hypothetical protein